MEAREPTSELGIDGFEYATVRAGRSKYEDRTAGRRITCPVLVHWGGDEGAMSDGPLGVWRRWADEVEGGPVRGGHFIPEEAADELTASLTRFLDS